MKIRFLQPGEPEIAAHAEPGERLLHVGQRHGLPLEGTCEGDLACATCHVIVAAEDFVRLPPASEEEEDMLDLARGATRFSRLSCQITLELAHDGLTVSVPE
jgi:ferredoxin